MNLGNCMAPLPGLIRLGRVSSALACPELRLRGLGLDAYDPVRHADDPCLFVGCYDGSDFAYLTGHKGPALLMFCGGDARNAPYTKLGAALRNFLWASRPRVRVLAPPTLSADLHRAEIEVDMVHGVYNGAPASFSPQRLGTHVYCYVPYERRDEYGLPMVAEIAARLPDFRFLLGRWGAHRPPFSNGIPLQAWLSPDVMPFIYGDCFCGIRTVARDGFPGTPVELALMGRPVAGILDYGVPWIEYAPTADALVAFVRRARARTEPDYEIARAARAHVETRSFLRLP